ncbi:MAG: HAD family hydrolase [Desulfohalobiaceae bacterium]|nr:HAD family hydrolase [Desulfohalobiaceae bacterium]
MTQIHGILFDFDGTLAELRIDFDRMRRQIAELAGLFFDQGVQSSSSPVLEWIDELAQAMQSELPREDVLEFQSRCRMRLVGLEMKAAKEGRLFPFTSGVLSGLRENRVKTAIVTRNCTAAVRAVYPGIEEAVDCLLARDDVINVKPDAEHLHAAARRLGVNNQACLMVGDHWLDITAARNAGMRSAAVHTGHTPAADLTSQGPDFSAPNAHSLVQELRRAGILAQNGQGH